MFVTKLWRQATRKYYFLIPKEKSIEMAVMDGMALNLESEDQKKEPKKYFNNGKGIIEQIRSI